TCALPIWKHPSGSLDHMINTASGRKLVDARRMHRAADIDPYGAIFLCVPAVRLLRVLRGCAFLLGRCFGGFLFPREIYLGIASASAEKQTKRQQKHDSSFHLHNSFRAKPSRSLRMHNCSQSIVANNPDNYKL